jgi:hypothetical protein
MFHVQFELESGEVLVARWRVEELERAGFDQRTAELLAAAAHVDLHKAIELVERGCPPETAARILL